MTEPSHSSIARLHPFTQLCTQICTRKTNAQAPCGKTGGTTSESRRRLHPPRMHGPRETHRRHSWACSVCSPGWVQIYLYISTYLSILYLGTKIKHETAFFKFALFPNFGCKRGAKVQTDGPGPELSGGIASPLPRQVHHVQHRTAHVHQCTPRGVTHRKPILPDITDCRHCRRFPPDMYTISQSTDTPGGRRESTRSGLCPRVLVYISTIKYIYCTENRVTAHSSPLQPFRE